MSVFDCIYCEQFVIQKAQYYVTKYRQKNVMTVPKAQYYVTQNRKRYDCPKRALKLTCGRDQFLLLPNPLLHDK
jgi:hypothetical protein